VSPSHDADQPHGSIVRGRCACGRRYRIVRAAPGVTVSCPQCGRTITVTRDDILAATGGTPFEPIQHDPEPREAILVDYGELTLAPAGSRPGYTGETFLDHEEAVMTSAMHGWRAVAFDDDQGPQGLIGMRPRVVRPFLRDLLLGFACGRVLNNAMNVFLTGLLWFLLGSLLLVVPQAPARLQPLAAVILIGAALLLGLYTVQFCWSVVRTTAAGQERVPWVPARADLWEHLFKPALWTLYVSGWCAALPLVALVFTPGPPDPRHPAVIALALLGALFWPGAMLAAALTDDIRALRLDRLVRAIAASGPAYGLTWLLATGALVAWVTAARIARGTMAGPNDQALVLLAPAALGAMYVTYLLYRTIGLLYRHRAARLPWSG